MYLLDTNVVSELRRADRAAPAVAAWAKSVPVSELFLSAMSAYEIDLGIRRLERRDPDQGAILRTWFTRRVLGMFRDRILPIDAAVASRCAGLQVPDPRPERDCFIAATALVHRLVLVTRNVRDFEPTGVNLFDPWNGQG